MALGIAASQACGVRRNFGTMTKPFHAGNAARGGVLAAELASEGFTSDLTAFEGEVGWANVFASRSMPSSDEWLARLGKPWELSTPGIVLKRYPACGCTHCALDALIAIKKEHGIEAAEIDSITCDASPLAKKVLLYSRPKTGLEGKFSMEFSLAVAAVEGQAGLRQYDDKWVSDPRVLALLPRIAFRTRADLEPAVSADAVPAEVTVCARGHVFTRKVLIPSGDPRNPMTQPQRREKFMDCTDGIVDDVEAARIFAVLEDLERVKSIASLFPVVQAKSNGVSTVGALGA
jgi:2-methylcitrate dehydratase PrpD